MGLLSFLFGGNKSSEDKVKFVEPKGDYVDVKDPLGLGREAAESHNQWLNERSKDP